MPASIIPDVVWDQIEPLLPGRTPSKKGGRPPIGDREVLTGIVFVLKMRIPWEELPQELGCGCGMTCLRRLKTWQEAGVWPQVQAILEEQLRSTKRIDWGRLRTDAGLGAQTGAEQPGFGKEVDDREESIYRRDGLAASRFSFHRDPTNTEWENVQAERPGQVRQLP